MAKKKERDLHYKVFAQRLDDENINWLAAEKTNYQSWNLLFKELRKRYEQQTGKKAETAQ